MLTDPLSIDIDGQGVDTTLPVLQEADYRFRIVESTIDTNNRNDGHNWSLKLALTAPTTAKDGREVKVDFPVFTTVALQPAPEAKDAEGFKRQLFTAVDAIFGTTKDNRPKFNVALAQSVVGKEVIGSVVSDEYPKGSGNFNNKIGRLKPLPATSL